MKRAMFPFCYGPTAARPWRDAGYQCWLIDIQHPAGVTEAEGMVLVGVDFLTWLPPRDDFTFAFACPPCTDLAVSGARWMKSKGLGCLAQAVALFGRAVEVCEWLGCAYAIENPVSTISTYYRSPDYTFDPCDYGDPYTKKTCLWTGGGFIMPPKNRVEASDGSKIHLIAPGPERANIRSATPPGFTQAMFDANEETP